MAVASESLKSIATGRIIVIEDDPVSISGSVRALREDGWLVDERPDVESAERALRTTRYDVIVLDLRLPYRVGEMEDDREAGDKLLRRLDAGDLGELNASTPCIIYTGQFSVAAHVAGRISPRVIETLSKGQIDVFLAKMRRWADVYRQANRNGDNQPSDKTVEDPARPPIIAPPVIVGNQEVVHLVRSFLAQADNPPDVVADALRKLVAGRDINQVVVHPRQAFLLRRLIEDERPPLVTQESLRAFDEYQVAFREWEALSDTWEQKVATDFVVSIADEERGELRRGRTYVLGAGFDSGQCSHSPRSHWVTCIAVVVRVHPSFISVEPDWVRYVPVDESGASERALFLMTPDAGIELGSAGTIEVEAYNGGDLIARSLFEVTIR